MSTANTISAWHGDNFSWIRCEGKGSFANSPQLKQWADKDLESGTQTIVVDLQDCTGMDSTFMGTLAGIAMKLLRIGNGKLQIASASEKNRASLEGLGLAAMLDIDPSNPEWEGQVDDVRKKLECCLCETTKQSQANHVLDAHKKLCDANQSNIPKFSSVLEYLEKEVQEKGGNKEE